MSQNKGKSKIDLRTLLSILLAVVVIVLILTGKIPLFGSNETPQNPTAPSTESQPGGIPIVTASAPATEGTKIPGSTAAPATTAVPVSTTPSATQKVQKDYFFRNRTLLNGHYDKHGKEMGFKSAKEYEAAASAVINNPDALYKTEKEDGDHVYYVVATNEFVVLSRDGYIRTYFLPAQGKKYFDRQ